MQKTDFIKKFSPHIVKACWGTGLFPSVFLAQMAVESSWAKADLSTQYNNFFGIKASASWEGETVQLATPNDKDKVSTFRVYATPYQSIKDRNKFLVENPRYKKAGVFKARDYKEQIQALSNAGYAENPKYAKLLTDIVEQNKLYEFDKLVQQTAEVQAVKTDAKPKKNPKIIALVSLLVGVGLLTTVAVIALKKT